MDRRATATWWEKPETRLRGRWSPGATVVGVALLLMGTVYADFSVETVDPVGCTWTSADVDPAGDLHIAYWVDETVLKYAERRGNSWIVSTIDQCDYYPSLDVDSSGVPHVCYRKGQELIHARRDAGNWVKTIVSEDCHGGAAIAVDDTGMPHISFCKSNRWRLHYARLTQAGWVTEEVDGEAQSGYSSSIRVDSQGRPHISHGYLYPGHSEGSRELRHAHKADGTWQHRVVDSGMELGTWTSSIALDSTGRPWISYGDDDFPFPVSSWLRCAHWDGTSWQRATVEQAERQVETTTIRLTVTDMPHITSAILNFPKTVKHAYGTSGNWSVSHLAPGHFCSLALALDGTPLIPYADHPFPEPKGDLRVITWDTSRLPPVVGETFGGLSVYPGQRAPWAIELTRGTEPLAVEWTIDGQALTAFPNVGIWPFYLFIGKASEAYEGLVEGRITNPWGMALGVSGMLTVKPRPTVVSSPPSLDALSNGDRVALFVESEDTVAGHSWFGDDTTLHGETGQSLTIPHPSQEDSGIYHCLVQSAVGLPVESSTVQLEISPVAWPDTDRAPLMMTGRPRSSPTCRPGPTMTPMATG